MITRDVAAFSAFARGCATDAGPATARAAFLVAPAGFRRADESAADNAYMQPQSAFRADVALAQHAALAAALSTTLPTLTFPGDPAAPDGVFPNNVFATAPGVLVVGRMRHAVRRREAGRADIRGFFTGVMGYRLRDLSQQLHACELTGALVVDRARGIGFCGLSERCDAEGAALMHAAFGLRATLLFDLAPGEYHANVVLAVLAGRAAVVCPAGFADAAVAEAIAGLYAPHALRVDARAQAAFAGNVIALSDDAVWMSATAAAALGADGRRALHAAGFALRSAPLDAIEAAGGSLRCCVGEIY